MTYLLDTNICIHYLRGAFNLDSNIQRIGFENCAISEITLAELIFGAENSANPVKSLAVVDEFVGYLTVLPLFDAVYLFGKEKAKLRREGMIISDFDLLIGCTALSNSMVMVTENVAEFKRIEGIQVENWIKRPKD